MSNLTKIFNQTKERTADAVINIITVLVMMIGAILFVPKFAVKIICKIFKGLRISCKESSLLHMETYESCFSYCISSSYNNNNLDG
jgi:hypothetical protein